MSLIAITHQLGSGGRQIGQRVAHELQLPYIDKEIVQGVAHKLGISEGLACKFDEKAEHLIGQIFASLRYGLVLSMPANAPAPLIDLTDYQKATQDIIATAAATHHAVIAGHGANFFLKNRACFYSVFIYGSFESRLARLMRREVISRADALKKLHKSDQEQAFYIKSLYHANWCDPDYYQLIINTAGVSLEHAVTQIIDLVK